LSNNEYITEYKFTYTLGWHYSTINNIMYAVKRLHKQSRQTQTQIRHWLTAIGWLPTEEDSHLRT